MTFAELALIRICPHRFPQIHEGNHVAFEALALLILSWVRLTCCLAIKAETGTGPHRGYVKANNTCSARIELTPSLETLKIKVP